MQKGKINFYLNRIVSKIYDPEFKEGYKPKYRIRHIRVAMLFFLLVSFHFIDKHPFFIFDVVNITEFLFLTYTFWLLFFVKKKLTPATQLFKLIFDFLFISIFEYLSLSLYGIHSWLYVLYLIPIIYCCYWFKNVFTIVFLTVVSATYSALNYYVLDLEGKFEMFYERISMLIPIVVMFYLIALGTSYYKRVKYRTAELDVEKQYTRNLLKSSFDAIIHVDKDGYISDVNERTCELFEYNREEMVKKKVKDFYAPGEGSRIMNKLRDTTDGSIENFDAYILSKRGEKIPILLSVAFLYDKSLNLKKELSKKRRFPTVGYFRDKRAEEAVDSIARDIISIADEKTLLDKIVKIVAQKLKAEACGILTYNESSGMLKVITSYGMPEILKDNEWVECYGENEDITGEIFSLKKTLNVSDINVPNKQPQDISIKWKYAQNFAKYSRFGDYKHFLGTPLFLKDEAYGVIRVLNKYSRDNELDKQGFTNNDQKLLERISPQISILIEKARDKERFEAISKVGRELNEMLGVSLDELLEIIAKEVVKGMRFKACNLRLIEGTENLKIKACSGLKGDYKGNDNYILLKINKGIAGEVVKTGEHRAITDLQKEEKFAFREILEREGLRSMLSVPLKYRDRVIGVINCYTGRIHRFTEQEIQIMNTFATYASTAIQNKKRVDELMALNEIGSELVKPIEIEELFDLILEKAKALSGADRLCIKIHNERSGKMETLYALNCDWQKKHKNQDLNIWEYIEDDVIIKGKSKIIYYSNEIREKCNILPDNELLMEINQSALIPIKIDNKVLGIIFLDSYRENFFTEDDLLVLKTFSSQAAIALRNARLFDKLQKVTETFPKISELDTDLDKVLQNIANISAEVLETDILLMYRWDEERKKIIWPPNYKGEIKYLGYMMSEEISSDTPIQIIKGGTSHYAEYSQEDDIMTSQGKPPLGDAPGRFIFREGIISSAGIILKVGQEKVGVMFINYRTHHKFDEDERKIIENYASYIAMAIQNVKHFSEKQASTRLQTLGQLAAVIAHKIKNDISPISLYTGDLIDEISLESPHYFNLTQIKEKVRKITSDIDNLLIASKKKIPEKELVDISTLINEIKQEIASDLKARKIELEKKIIANTPEIKADPAQIRMVLSNLAYNSIEAMPDGGKITVSISKSKNGVVLLDWKDTGKGISPDVGEKIFQPFWTTKNKGFGLGLFLSKSIIEEHGGTISLDLNYKKGARFMIEFPIEELI